MKTREVNETLKKEFLLDLLEPFHPTLKANERIVNLFIETKMGGFKLKYTIVKEV